MKLQPVILCGGSGKRLWPESRQTFPKQFIPLVGETSTFQETLLNVSHSELFSPPLIVSHRDYQSQICDQLDSLGIEATLLLEPFQRDSAPAIALATEWACRYNPSALLLILPADQLFQPQELFHASCQSCLDFASTHPALLCWGLEVLSPSPDYGYIQPGAPLSSHENFYKVLSFVEKPPLPQAHLYQAQHYLWNAGLFIAQASYLQREFQRLTPQISTGTKHALDRAHNRSPFIYIEDEAFSSVPCISFDYAIVEKISSLFVFKASLRWIDVGNWSVLRKLIPRDSHQNSIQGKGWIIDSENIHIRSKELLTTVVGLKNVTVITTPDAVLVMDETQAHKIKILVGQLEERFTSETKTHQKTWRLWGYYQVLTTEPRYQVKRIVVKPSHRLSFQKHYHRSEHWIVVKGVAEVMCGTSRSIVHENESIYIPVGTVHCLMNIGKIDLELIEVQTGSYLGEDDILRLKVKTPPQT